MTQQGAGTGMVERAARALYEAQRKSELSKIASLSIDCAFLDVAAEELSKSDRRLQTLVGFSTISKCLDLGMRANLRYSSKKELSDLIEGLGPLSTDSARLRLAKALGWLPREIAEGVDAFRKTRNRIAHDIMRDEDVRLPEEMAPVGRKYLDDALSQYLAPMAEDREPFVLPAEKMIGAMSIILAVDLLECIVSGPAKLRLGLGQRLGPIYGGHDSPGWAQQAKQASVRGVWLLAGYVEETAGNLKPIRSSPSDGS